MIKNKKYYTYLHTNITILFIKKIKINKKKKKETNIY